MTEYIIDWDNLQPCTGGLVISPNVCLDSGWVDPVDPTPTPVPVPATLWLMVIGLGMLMKFRGRRAGK